MKQPPWYTASENFLEKQGRPVILLIFAIILVITLVMMLRVYQGKSLLPATTWLVYLMLP
jgi:hypothetical protein